jgi:thioredoxin
MLNRQKSITIAVLLTIGISIFPKISYSAEAPAKKPASLVKTVSGVEEFKKLIDTSGNRLLMFDLYADWCMPCRMLSPTLEEIAKEYPSKVSVYKINTDKNPDIAQGLGVTGIPFVVFVKNKTGVHAMTGVQPKAEYIRAINMFSASSPDTTENTDIPDGTLIEGVRVIKLTTATTPGDLYVYRGETVKIIIDKVDIPYSISIPQYSISSDAVIGQNLEVSFKAEDIGVFPIFCNGKCPSGNGSNYGRIIVMQYKGEGKFSELDVKSAKTLITTKKALILDVRTPAEYHKGHIAGAKLIPLQQLESRWKEIENYKDTDILVYCRSGNRSTVASQILVKQGFTKLHNLRHGVIGWEKAGEKLVAE